MTAPLVDGGSRVAVLLGLLGRRVHVIAWFTPLRSNEASHIELTTISVVFAVQLCSKIYTPFKNGFHAGLDLSRSTSIASL